MMQDSNEIYQEQRTIPQTLPWLGKEEAAAVSKVLEDNWITEGKAADEFVEALKALTGVPYGVLAPNGTLALTLGLLALGIGRGDEVLVPNITFVGSATAVVLAGATPVFMEVEGEFFQFDPACAAKCLSERTRAIMPVHLFGTSCDMQSVREFAQKFNLLVIEDAAQGIGVRFLDSHVGSMGDVGCFSFFADKTITTGEGGFVGCSNEATYKKLLYIRNQGRLERGSFIHPEIGFNFRMTDLQAAIGLVQLKKLDTIIQSKQKLFNIYVEGLRGLPEVRVLSHITGSNHVPFRCVLMAERRDDLQSALERAGIRTRSFFFPLHRQPCFSNSGETDTARSLGLDSYPISDHGFKNGLCLPVYPTLDPADVSYIVSCIRNFYKR